MSGCSLTPVFSGLRAQQRLAVLGRDIAGGHIKVDNLITLGVKLCSVHDPSFRFRSDCHAGRFFVEWRLTRSRLSLQ
jgi:hypothetical protein